ncbi:MAG: VWA domain-containing protein [Halanaerobacter sp.]
MEWSKFEFGQLGNLIYFLIPVLVLIILILAYRKRDKIIKQLEWGLNYRYKILKIVLVCLGLGLIVFSLLGPQVLEGYQEVEEKGLDIYLCVDTSKSMLAQDVEPSRLKRVQRGVEQLLNSLDGDRVGLIPFASDAYVQMPLTSDYRLAKMFLEVIDTNMIAGGGTNIASALELAQESFDRSAQGEKVIIIFSDGETHNSEGVQAAQNLENTRVYTVGVGTKKGALIPEYNAQGEKVGYRKDSAGQHVNSKLNQAALEKIAQQGEAEFYRLDLQNQAVEKLIREIAQLEEREFSRDKIKKFKQLYQYFLAAGLILFIVGYFLPERGGTE